MQHRILANVFIVRFTGSEAYSHTMETSETSVSFTKDQQVTVLQDTIAYTLSRFVADFTHVSKQFINEMTIEGNLLPTEPLVPVLIQIQACSTMSNGSD